MSEGSYMLPPIGGLDAIPQMGQSVSAKYSSVEYRAETPSLESIPEKHPWLVTRTRPNKFSVAGGKVFGRDGSMAEITEPVVVETESDGYNVWVKITRAGTEVTAAEFGQGGDVPEDTAGFIYRIVASFYRLPGGASPYLAINQIESSNLRLINTPEEIQHPWKAEYDGTFEVWNVSGGSIFGVGDDMVMVADGGTVVGTGYIYLKISLSNGSELVSGELNFGTTIPDNTSTEIYRELAQINEKQLGRQTAFEHIYLFGGVNGDSGANGVNHPWKVVASGAEVKEGSPQPLNKFVVTGGSVYCQASASPVVVADTSVLGLAGFVVLKTVRDSSSREITSATIEYQAVIPADDYSDQYRPLAEVFLDQSVLQLQFQEIRIWELMLVENGEFKLLPFDISSRSSYVPPT